MQIKLPIFLKIVLYQILFLLVHYSYDWFPNSLTNFFAPTSESVYQHMKGAFYTYLLLVGIEYILACKMIVSKSRYFYARLAGGIFLPLIMMPYYLLGPALFVQIESIPLEIVFANLALLATSASAFLLETVFEKSEQTAGVKTILVLLFLITLFEFIVFNTRLPWYDIFANPPGW